MISIKTNISQVVQVINSQLTSLADTDKMLRDCAITALALMKVRIHEKGLDADGNKIGTYSKGYMVVRTGGFQNAAKISRGKNKGNLKDAGVFTDRTIRLDKKTGVFTGEDKVGKARPKYNRGTGTTVILSLTRQMENDEKVIAVAGGYGIGFTNAHNFDKSQWNEATYNRRGKIFSLSADELKAVTQVAETHANNALPR